MALSREKRSNAGKAPQRLEEALANTPPPSTQPKASKRAVSKARPVSITLKGPSRPDERLPAVSKRAHSAPKAQATQPASLRREDDIPTASPSIESLSSDDDEIEAVEESIEFEEGQKFDRGLTESLEGVERIEEIENDSENESAADIEWASFSIELRVLLGKRAIHNTHIDVHKLDFDSWVSDADRRAEEAAAKLNKSAERLDINASIKYGSGRPYELTIEDAGDILDVHTQVNRVRVANKSSSQAQLRVGLVATFVLVKRSDSDSDSSAKSEEIPSTQKISKRARSEVKTPIFSVL